jgi:hypothetical protein
MLVALLEDRFKEEDCFKENWLKEMTCATSAQRYAAAIIRSEM